ncbi:occludin [Alligator mississippiensis]|uniref:Occludin n=1 Tax=Alligator mississippiensis TaxID=8496 RepID=A0A151PHW9_ALLMI|nr:occludin [Alligator mississippiensis]
MMGVSQLISCITGAQEILFYYCQGNLLCKWLCTSGLLLSQEVRGSRGKSRAQAFGALRYQKYILEFSSPALQLCCPDLLEILHLIDQNSNFLVVHKITIHVMRNGAVNQRIYVYLYWYHYCILDIEEIISIVLVCLIILGLIAIIILALITRNRIHCCGKRNIMWYRRQVCEPAPKIQEWPKNTKTGCSEIVPVLDCQDQLPTSMTHPVYSKANECKGYTDNTYKYSQDHFELIKDVKPSDYFSKTTYIGSTKRLSQKIRAERPNIDNYDMDYTTAGESCDELDIKEEWDREYPPVTSDEQRQAYKRDFDAELQEYRGLQAELEEIKEELRYLDKELDEYNEDTEEYKAAADEYNRLKDIKASADYTNKKAQFKKLKNKLSHIKKMVNDYDNQKP